MSSILRIRNDFSWFLSDDSKAKETLWRALRFPAKNYWHSRLYRQKLWDGYNEFYKKETGRFLTGLLPEVRAALKHLKTDYRVIDEREKLEFATAQIDCEFLQRWNPFPDPFILHDYQVDLVHQAIKHHRGTVFAPTSAGKTMMMVALIKCLPPQTPAMILTNRSGLSQQIHDELVQWGCENVGRCFDKICEPDYMTVANYQSLHKISKLVPHVKVLLVDEIHEMISKEPKKWYKKFKSASVRVCFSATPFKYDGADKTQKYEVKGYFGAVFKTTSEMAEDGILTTAKLQKHGKLAKSKCVFYPVREPDIVYDIYMDAKIRGIAENWHFHEIVRDLTLSLKGRTLIIVEHLDHGNTLNEMLPGSVWVRGEDDLEKRKEVVRLLSKSKDDCVAIATQGIFNTGINVKVHNLINAAGGAAEHLIKQKMGRGLRVANDKLMLHYYDFIFYINPYLKKHSVKRCKVLKNEGHQVIVKDELDFPRT